MIKKLFGLNPESSNSIVWVCVLHVIHAFLYGAFGGIRNNVQISSTNWNLVFFTSFWQFAGIVIEYYIAFRYIQLIINAVIKDIGSKKEMPGKHLFTVLGYILITFVGVRSIEYFGSVVWKLLFVAIILMVLFLPFFMVAGSSVGGFYMGELFVITASSAALMAEVITFFSWLAPIILGIAALDIVIDTIRYLFG